MHDELGVVEVGVLIAGEVGGEGLEVELGDIHFVGEEAFAVVGDDEVDFVSFGEELVEEAGGVDGSGGAGDGEDVAV